MRNKEAYCSYEVAKLLKEKGFKEDTNTWYNLEDDKPEFTEGYVKISNVDFVANDENCCSAPTHQMACAWLREKGIYIEIGIVITTDDKVYYHANVGTITYAWKLVDEWNDSYENSVEAALKYILENLI